jgi:membrane protease YdiL (CAAX protease family)
VLDSETVASVEVSPAGTTQMWRCRCGYVNVGSGRCETCGSSPAAATETSIITRVPGSQPARPATAVAAPSPKTAPLYAPPALLILVIGIVAGNYAYQHGVVSLLSGSGRNVALLVALLCGLLFYLVSWVVASSVARTVRVAPVMDRSPRRAVLAGLVVGGIAAAFGAAAAFSSKGRAALDPTAALLIDDGRWTALLIGVVVIVVAAPLVEEYIFRGLLAQTFAEHSRAAALWFSSIAFAAAHLSPVRFPYYLIMGVVFGRLYLRRGLLASITAHALLNGAVLATAAIVLTTSGSTTTTAAGLRLTLPPGWHEVTAPDAEDLAAAGPNGAVLEVLHNDVPAGASVDVEAIMRSLRVSPSFGGITVQGSTAHTRLVGAGLAVQADITSATETGSVELIPTGRVVHILVIHAPGTVDFTADFEAMLASTRAAP